MADLFDQLEQLLEEWGFSPSDKFVHLPQDQMREVIEEGTGTYVLAADIVDYEVIAMIWIEGQIAMSYMHKEIFNPQAGSSSPQPNFDEMRIGDFGHWLAFGDYQAAADSLLVKDG